MAGIVHTHSPFATAWAQACREIPCFGTTHADHFRGSVPVTRALTAEEIAGDYEARTGDVIVETLAALGLEPLEMPAALVASHGPFAWGADVAEAVENAVALEAVAAAALRTEQLRPGAGPIADELLLRHFSRKHGPAAYYGQPTTPLKALRLHGPGDLRLHDEPEPQPGDGEALLRVTAVGLCGSDRHWFVEGSIGDAVLREPLVLGHEFVGTIESGPRAGERVVADPADPCLSLRRLPLGAAAPLHRAPIRRPRLDRRRAADAARLAGAAACTRCPTRCPMPRRCCSSRSGSRSTRSTSALVRLGTAAGVFGCGPLGLLLVELLRMAGASVVAADPLPHRARRRRAARRGPAPRQRRSTSRSRSPATTGRSPPRSTPSGPAAASSSSGSPTATARASPPRRSGGRS